MFISIVLSKATWSYFQIMHILNNCKNLKNYIYHKFNVCALSSLLTNFKQNVLQFWMQDNEISGLFQYIDQYKPRDIEIGTTLKPFLPDEFIKVPRPDDRCDNLGLKVRSSEVSRIHRWFGPCMNLQNVSMIKWPKQKVVQLWVNTYLNFIMACQ